MKLILQHIEESLVIETINHTNKLKLNIGLMLNKDIIDLCNRLNLTKNHVKNIESYGKKYEIWEFSGSKSDLLTFNSNILHNVLFLD